MLRTIPPPPPPEEPEELAEKLHSVHNEMQQMHHHHEIKHHQHAFHHQQHNLHGIYSSVESHHHWRGKYQARKGANRNIENKPAPEAYAMKMPRSSSVREDEQWGSHRRTGFRLPGHDPTVTTTFNRSKSMKGMSARHVGNFQSIQHASPTRTQMSTLGQRRNSVGAMSPKAPLLQSPVDHGQRPIERRDRFESDSVSVDSTLSSFSQQGAGGVGLRRNRQRRGNHNRVRA